MKLRRSLGFVFAATAALSFVSAAVFMFSLMAGTFSDIARRAASDPAGAEFARMIANDRAIKATARAVGFLLVQGAIQLAALALSARISSRGLEAEFARMQRVIGEQRKRLEEAAALSAWKEVASFLGHQLKNPLAAIELAASNAEEAFSRAECADAKMHAMVGDSLTAIRQESARMTGIVSRLKSLTAFQEPRFEPRPLEAIVHRAAGRHGASTLRLEVNGAAVVHADEELLTQALVNLLNNSVEAAGADLPVRVSIQIQEGERGIELRYEDSCRLSDPSLAQRLGSERISTKATGSGLGLLFSSRIMSIHGGSLQPSLSPQGGLALTLRFPCTEDS